jgi:hypothetical protein
VLLILVARVAGGAARCKRYGNYGGGGKGLNCLFHFVLIFKF